MIGPPPVIAAAAQGFGAVVLLPDADGRIRRVPLLVTAEGGLRPGLAMELLRVGLGASGLLVEETPPTVRVGPLAVPLEPDAQFRIVPSSTAMWERRTISAASVMSDTAARARLAGQVVLIGSSAPEAGGLRVTPSRLRRRPFKCRPMRSKCCCLDQGRGRRRLFGRSRPWRQLCWRCSPRY